MDQPRKISARLYLTKDGPIRVEGNFFVTNIDGESLVPDGAKEVFLCACGKSKSKPFCDGSHKSAKVNDK